MRETQYLLGMMVAVVAVLALACGGDGGDNDSGGNGNPDGDSFNTTHTGPDLPVGGPPSLYAPFLDEMPGLFTVHPGDTFGMAASTFASIGPFTNTTDGEALAEEWGYQGGYQVRFEPDGLLAGVLQGRYYATTVVHQFETTAGASQAYDYFVERTSSVTGSEDEPHDAVGNESGAWSFIEGTVGDTDIVAIHHRILFRRGNLLVDVRTYGGEPFMTVRQASEIARIIDERALGERDAELPTPIARPTSPAF